MREKTSRSQAQVAGASEISVSMLSQIERGRVSPSIDTLLRVCAALDLEVSEVFERLAPGRPVRIYRPGERLRSNGEGVVYEQLAGSPDPAFPSEMFLLEVEPGRRIGFSGSAHEGIEMGYVLSGRAVISLGGRKYEVTRGDSVSFSAQVPHRLSNHTGSCFRAIWTVMPPHKDYLELESHDSSETAAESEGQ